MHHQHGIGAAGGERHAPARSDRGMPTHTARFPPRFDAAPKGTAAEDVSRHENTVAGNLAFLRRYAFGGY